MSRILVTGSNDGIGAEIARILTADGHDVIRHARSAERAAGPGFVVGELSSLQSTRDMAADVLRLGAPDVVVHNAGWGSKDESRPVTGDGWSRRVRSTRSRRCS